MVSPFSNLSVTMTRSTALRALALAGCAWLALAVPAAGATKKAPRPVSPDVSTSLPTVTSEAPAPRARKVAPPATDQSQPPKTILVPPSNDLCSGAILITCGNIEEQGNTLGGNNDYTFTDTTLSCTGYLEDGVDVVYKFAAIAGDSVWLRLSTPGDGCLYIVTNCSNVQGSCVVGADDQQAGAIEDLRYRFPTSGTYYLIIDSFGANTTTAYTLVGQFISCGLFPPPNDRCEIATPILCGQFGFTGSTQTAFNDYHFPSSVSCVASQANGRDIAYRLDVSAGDSLSCDYLTNANGVMYILNSCGDPVSSCVVGTNETGTNAYESFRWRFAYSGTYYLILDSAGSNDFGSWSLVGNLVCGITAPPNDRCEGALQLYCGSFSLSGSTELALNDYFLPDTTASCTGFASNGPEVVYRLDVSPGDSLWLDYRSTADASVYIVTSCTDVFASCIYGLDQAVTNETEYLRYVFSNRGTYYLILDSYEAIIWGDWTAIGGIICPPLLGVDDPGRTAEFRLGEFQPNPFGNATAVRFTVPQTGPVTLRVYDLAGRVVKTLVDGSVTAGEHASNWDARDETGQRVPAGMYFARLSIGSQTALRKMLFVH